MGPVAVAEPVTPDVETDPSAVELPDFVKQMEQAEGGRAFAFHGPLQMKRIDLGWSFESIFQRRSDHSSFEAESIQATVDRMFTPVRRQMAGGGPINWLRKYAAWDEDSVKELMEAFLELKDKGREA